jgi:hypothetical protein
LGHQALDNPWFPYGTLFVNLIGCLVIGFLGGLMESRHVFNPETRLLGKHGVVSGARERVLCRMSDKRLLSLPGKKWVSHILDVIHVELLTGR